MRDCDAGLVNFTIDEECRHARRFGFFQWTNGGIGARVIENDGFCFSGYGGLNQLVLFIDVIIMRGNQRGISQRFRFGDRAVGFGFKERVVV